MHLLRRLQMGLNVSGFSASFNHGDAAGSVADGCLNQWPHKRYPRSPLAHLLLTLLEAALFFAQFCKLPEYVHPQVCENCVTVHLLSTVLWQGTHGFYIGLVFITFPIKCINVTTQDVVKEGRKVLFCCMGAFVLMEWVGDQRSFQLNYQTWEEL